VARDVLRRLPQGPTEAFWKALILAFSLVLAGTTEQRSEPLWRPATVRLSLDGEPRCLGVRVAADVVLTAQHCVQEPGSPGPVHVEGLQITAAGSAAVARGVDVELSRPGAYADVGDLLGTDVARVRAGTSGGSQLPRGTIRTSTLFAVRRADDGLYLQRVRVRSVGAREIYVSPAVEPGDSGGPLLGPDGAVVGIASWRSSLDDGRGSTSAYTRVDLDAPNPFGQRRVPISSHSDPDTAEATSPVGLRATR